MDEPSHAFHPTLLFDESYWVHDFSRPSPDGWKAPYKYSVGRYDENRPMMYTTELFEGERTHHVGLDLGAPHDTPVYAFGDGKIFAIAMNDEPGSYGPTLITEHHLSLPDAVGGQHMQQARTFWVLYGHLSWDSLQDWTVGDRFEAGDVIARLGHEDENGGWPPHVHVQMAWKPPEDGDLPGVVRPADREAALQKFPDPRLICGPLY